MERANNENVPFSKCLKEGEEKEEKTEPRFILRGVLCDRSLGCDEQGSVPIYLMGSGPRDKKREVITH
jgi:hypothetical protein